MLEKVNDQSKKMNNYAHIGGKSIANMLNSIEHLKWSLKK